MNYHEHHEFITLLSVVIAILLILGSYGTYYQLKNERIKNVQQKSEYQDDYTPGKSFRAQNGG